jgi:hypothetical protein
VPGIDKTENSYKQDPAPGLAAAPRRSAAYRHIADLTRWKRKPSSQRKGTAA